MKKILFLLILCLSAQFMHAQAPKWVDKAKRAVFSIITYDQADKILNTGNGFFVTNDGVALSNYSTFKGAQRAIIINSDGKQMPVELILGENELYDVIKFKVGITEKNVQFLNIASNSPAVGTEVFLLPYSTQKDKSVRRCTVENITKLSEQYDYYTLNLELTDKMVSCPVVNAEGLVFGISQKATGKDTLNICYAVSAAYAMSRNIPALALNDQGRNGIGIKKGLPDTEDQALVSLYLASTQLEPEAYISLLNDFIAKYPNNPEGYMRRAAFITYNSNDQATFANAAADFDRALKVAPKKEEVYYTLSKQIYQYQLEAPETTYNDWTYDKALEYINKAISLDPLPLYMLHAGDVNFAKRDYEQASQWYEKVNNTFFASPSSFFSAAKTKEIMGAEPKEVIALLDSAINRAQPLNEVSSPYLLERAQMYMNAEQYRQAVVDYDAYHDIVKGNVNDLFYYYREQAAFKARQYQRALDDIAKAISLNPDEMMYRGEEAVINIRVGRYQEAIDVLNNALKVNPNYAEAYRLIGICQLQLKDNAAACVSLQRAKELGDEAAEELIQKHCK